MGVEPTRDRLTAPPGFEVRTPHRGRFSSIAQAGRWAEQVEPPPVDASQVAAADGDAVAIEEFENLDSDLSAIVEPVAELRGVEAGGIEPGKLLRDADHLGKRAA